MRRTLSLLSLIGCVWCGWVSNAADATTNEPTLPSPASALRYDAERKIAPTDLLLISIVGERDLQVEFRVSASGAIQFPFLEIVEVAGLTPMEVKSKLETELSKDYFVAPEVIVTVRDYRPDFVRVIGQVVRAGPVAITGEQKMDIIDVIAMAGGTTRSAKNSVEYTHKGVTRTLKLEDLKKETDPAKKVYAQPGDIIEVKEGIL